MEKITKWYNKEHVLNNSNKDIEENDLLCNYNSNSLNYNENK